MSAKGVFENSFKDFSVEAASAVLNELQNGLSEHLLSEIENFKVNRLHHLTTNMKSDIFCDNTVYTGSAGLALYYFVLSLGKHKPDSELMMNALPYLDLNNLKGRRITFLCGDAGPLAIATVISYKLGQKKPAVLPDYKESAQRLMSLIILLNDSPDEILYGKCGYLYALMFVNHHVSQTLIPDKHIEKVVSAILKSGKKFASRVNSDSPLLWQWHDKVYLGAAHGVAGILYLLLQARKYIDEDDMNTYVKPTLDWLVGQQFSSGNFPSSLGSSSGDRLVQWCHGAPGFVALLILAAEVFEEDKNKYIKIALKCGDIVWQKGLSTKGYSLCHGVAGNAYTFLELYQATKSPVQLYRASCFLKWCVAERPGTERHTPDRPASLFEGILGRLYLIEQFNQLDQVKFPAFTL